MSSVYLSQVPKMDPTVPASAAASAAPAKTSAASMTPLGLQSNNNQSLEEELQHSMGFVWQYCKYYTEYLQAQLFTSEGETPEYPANPFTAPSSVNSTNEAAAAANSNNRNSISISDSVRAILSHPSNLPTAIAAVCGMPVIGGPIKQEEDFEQEPEEKEQKKVQVKEENDVNDDEDIAMEEGVDDGNEENITSAGISPSKTPKKKSKKKKAVIIPAAPTITRHGRVVKKVINTTSMIDADTSDEDDDEDMDDEEDDEEEEEETDSEDEAAGRSNRKRSSSVTHHAGADGKQRRSKLPLRAVLCLRQFFVAHVDHPFPSDAEKLALAEECQLNIKQISDWFTNTRKVREIIRKQRFWRPYVDLLAAEGCVLFTNKFAICNCNARKGKKMQHGKNTSAAAAAAAQAPAASNTLNHAPKHHWMEMWK